MEKKILIAFDDSEYSLKAVRHVAEHFTNDHKITILSVVPNTAAICTMFSPELLPHFVKEQAVFCAMEEKNKDLLREAQKKAREILLKNGFKEEDITLKTETVVKGVATDIVNEAREGYDGIVMGRRGLSGIKEFLMGSVSHKVLSSARNIPVSLVE